MKRSLLLAALALGLCLPARAAAPQDVVLAYAAATMRGQATAALEQRLQAVLAEKLAGGSLVSQLLGSVDSAAMLGALGAARGGEQAALLGALAATRGGKGDPLALLTKLAATRGSAADAAAAAAIAATAADPTLKAAVLAAPAGDKRAGRKAAALGVLAALGDGSPPAILGALGVAAGGRAGRNLERLAQLAASGEGALLLGQLQSAGAANTAPLSDAEWQELQALLHHIGGEEAHAADSVADMRASALKSPAVYAEARRMLSEWPDERREIAAEHYEKMSDAERTALQDKLAAQVRAMEAGERAAYAEALREGRVELPGDLAERLLAALPGS